MPNPPRPAPSPRARRSPQATVWCASVVALLALGAGCLGTPLPDPPSFSGEAVTLSDSGQSGTVRLVGDPGAVRPGGVTLRITTPPGAGVLVATNPDGSFGRIVPGLPGERLFFELVLPSEDRFVGAFTGTLGGRLTPADPGPDGDGDGSPDLVDCAPADATLAGRRCAVVPACTTSLDCAVGQTCDAGVCVAEVSCRLDADCSVGQTCVSGLCSTTAPCTPIAETCNALDDDCNGLVDDGDPGGGVPCTATDACPGAAACTGAAVECVSLGPSVELCNGVDDDCDGVVDDGCV